MGEGRKETVSVREAAFLSLIRCGAGGKYSNLELDAALKKYGFTGADRGFFTALVYGTLEKQITLDYVIGQFSDRAVEKIEDKLLCILRMGCYQILFLDRIPDSAACNESVELAKKYTHKGTSGYVNGVLRSIVRSKERIPFPPEGTPEYDAVRYACPPWLCAMWREMYGEEKSRVILSGINRAPGITLRVNTLKTTREALLAVLREKGIGCAKTALSPFGITLTDPVPVPEITPLAQGLCFVQDESSQLCAAVLGARPGETVIDTCACPGGKSFGIAMDMENSGTLYSFDLHASKLSLIAKGGERLGISVIRTAERNASLPVPPEERGTADRVLCDVPCSGLGVIARKPDLRQKRKEDIDRLPAIQLAIVNAAADYVRPGGVLLYSTCTVNRAENEETAEKFLAARPDFIPTGEGMPEGKPMLTLFPGEKGTDGFFMAKFTKTVG